MAISDHVRSQLFREAELIRIPVTRRPVASPCMPRAAAAASSSSSSRSRTPGSRHGVWTKREHALFLEALDRFPAGPWKAIAAHVGSKTARQAMTHGQKYRQKIARRQRGLKKHVRDLDEREDDEQQVEPEEEPLEHEEARLDAEAALPVAFSDDEFAAFLANLDVQVAPSEASSSDSPLFVPDTPVDVANYPLELDDGFALDAAAPTDALPHQVQHLAVMTRADMASDELLSPMLLAELHRNASAAPLAFDEDDMEEMAPFLPSLSADGKWGDAALEHDVMQALMDPTGGGQDEPLDAAPFQL